MRKLFYAVVALSLFATSCAKDEAAAPEATAKTKTVTFTVKAPEMQVRSGEGLKATQLYFAFYDANDNQALTSLPNAIKGEEGWNGLTGKTIEVTLIDGKEYYAIFWAQSPNAQYSPDLANSKKVTFDFASLTDREDYDAFYAYVPSISTDLTGTQNVELKRPFAQINIGAPQTDIDAGKAAGTAVNSTKITLANVPNQLDLVSGAVSGEAKAVFGWYQAGSELYPVNNTEYKILAYTYVLVGKDVSDKALETVGFEMSDALPTGDHTDIVPREFTSVPVVRNHRTYILGNVVTSTQAPLTYVVKIAPDFDNDGNHTIINQDGAIEDANN